MYFIDVLYDLASKLLMYCVILLVQLVIVNVGHTLIVKTVS